MLVCTRVVLFAAVLASWTSIAFADGIEPGLWKITTRVETGGVVGPPRESGKCLTAEETRDLAPPPFENVKQRVEQMVQAKKFKSYVDELMKTAKVEKKLETSAPAAAPVAGSATAGEKPETK